VLHGRRLGDFVLRECIGEGAFAAVYRCEQPLLGREAVIKVLHQRLRASEVVLQRFLREARLASRLDHPYAAHVYAFGVEPDDGLAWIAMELVHGTSLARWLSERGPLPLEMLVSFFEQVAEIVQNAHDHGIVHRDLKPSNVMLIEYAGKVFPKLLDFGIAKIVDEAAVGGTPTPFDVTTDDPTDVGPPAFTPLPESSNVNLTQANATLGSPPYMSPEQWCNPLSVGPRSDLYSLAVMAYEALTGRQPFTGPTIAAIGEQHCNSEVPPVGDPYPAALDRVFRRALAKNPSDRPVSALAFASELRAAAFPPRNTAADPTHPTEPIVPLRRRRLWPLAAGAAAVVAGSVATYGFMTAGRDRGLVLSPASAAHTVEPAPPGPAPISPRGGETRGAVAAAVAPTAPPMVTVDIDSTPPGADVFRIPSDTKVGTTPWHAELPSEDGTRLFLIRKIGFGERQVEIDLRTGGTRTVKLPRMIKRPAPPAPPPPPGRAPARREGEPIDPFRTGGT
jgi:serine/threonine-protein kinase